MKLNFLCIHLSYLVPGKKEKSSYCLLSMGKVMALSLQLLLSNNFFIYIIIFFSYPVLPTWWITIVL